MSKIKDKCGCGRMWPQPGGHAEWCPRLDLKLADTREERIEDMWERLRHEIDTEPNLDVQWNGYDPMD